MKTSADVPSQIVRARKRNLPVRIGNSPRPSEIMSVRRLSSGGSFCSTSIEIGNEGSMSPFRSTPTIINRRNGNHSPIRSVTILFGDDSLNGDLDVLHVSPKFDSENIL